MGTAAATGTEPAVETQAKRARRIGVRIWLGAAFAAVGLITAASVYVFVRDSSGRTLRTQAVELAVGRTVRLADELGDAPRGEVETVLSGAESETFRAWAIRQGGPPFGSSPPLDRDRVERSRLALFRALQGRRFTAQFPGDVSVVAAPIFGPRGISGAVISRSTPPPELKAAADNLRGDARRALAIAIVVGTLIGFAIASLIATRVKRLARAAELMAGGRFDVPLTASGADEIADLTSSLESMRQALRDSFDMLATERDRLSAILSGLDEAVMVVGEEGAVRFWNPAAEPLVRDGQPATSLIPTLRRAAETGSAEQPWMSIGDRVYAAHARRVAAEHAVLVVVRDRTEEVQREIAEREFISNASHELRNPLAGISGAIEVLRSGAKDDEAALEHFLERLAADAERMTRLIDSLLTLARVEAVGEREEAEIVDVGVAAEEALGSIEAEEGLKLHTEIAPDLVAEGDPVLVRQVLIGLLTNACKNTPPPGTITLRARRGRKGQVEIEVEDTGKGIAAEEQDRVFDRFYRGSGALESEGFGLGLAIARRMVDVMGGEIGLRSRPGHGSVFWVRLRAAKLIRTPVA